MIVASAAADDVLAACRVLFAQTAFAELAARRFQAMLADLDPAGLIVAKDATGIRGAMFAYRLGGRQAAVWLPVAADDATQDALVAGVLAWIGREPTTVIQAIARQPELPRTPALLRAGFRHVTRLTFLTRDGSAVNRPPRGELRLRPVPGVTSAFADLLLRTYDGTRDVPELNGYRTGEDILAGYQAVIAGRPPHWWRVEHNGEPVGVLLLSPTDDQSLTELTYLGLVPAARGRGWGRQVLQFALSVAGAMTLTVDVRNEPALRLYRAAGFRETDRREVFLFFP